MKITMYDPPSGWMFGFPRPYAPLPGESIEETLVRDGYPKKDAGWASSYCRFWDTEVVEEFCLRCGAGVGKFRREGEGTCPECDPEVKNGRSIN